MAIGRTFEESLQKAIRMLHPSLLGFSSKRLVTAIAPESVDDSELYRQLRIPSNNRIYYIAEVRQDNRLNDGIKA